MQRNRVRPTEDEGALARIVWWDGAFFVECSGRGTSMELSVYYERYVMARETVESAVAGWQRSREICLQLLAGDLENYERSSGS